MSCYYTSLHKRKVALVSLTPHKFAIRRVLITECNELKQYDAGVASSGIMFLRNFVKFGHLVEKETEPQIDRQTR